MGSYFVKERKPLFPLTESRDEEEDEAERFVAISRVFLKTKTLNYAIARYKPFSLKGFYKG